MMPALLISTFSDGYSARSQLDGAHAGIGARHLVQQRLAAAADDDPVAQLVERFGQAATDARGAAGDEDGIVGQLHDSSPLIDERNVFC